MECRSGEQGDKAWRHITVKLSIFLSFALSFLEHNCFHSGMHARYATSWQSCISGISTSIIKLVAQFIHSAHCSSHPFPYKHRPDPPWYVYQLASTEKAKGSQRNQSLKPVPLSEHTLFTYYRQCTVCMCSLLWRFFLFCLLTKPLLLT